LCYGADVADLRRYERIEAVYPCRLFILDDDPSLLRFEAFLATRNVGLGGVFVESTFLLKTNLRLWLDLGLPSKPLRVMGRVAHVIALDDPEYPSGFGIEFLEVDSAGREVLMRDFSPPRYVSFYRSMLEEMPHLERTFTSHDASLLLNLWEEWKIVKAGGPLATESGAPEPTPLRKKRTP
jgi:hypothetical protein